MTKAHSNTWTCAVLQFQFDHLPYGLLSSGHPPYYGNEIVCSPGYNPWAAVQDYNIPGKLLGLTVFDTVDFKVENEEFCPS